MKGAGPWARRRNSEVGSAGTGAIRSPGGRPIPPPPTAPRTSCSSSSTTSGSPSSAATAPTSPPRRSTPWRPGVRLANFRTTALCSPTRSCLLTGRNHHRSGMGRVADLASGFPGYWGDSTQENGFLSEILRVNGYATYAVGKWHLTPEDETHMAASRQSWPLARGFDRWYGFHGGETHQFVPSLYHDNHSLQPPARPRTATT